MFTHFQPRNPNSSVVGDSTFECKTFYVGVFYHCSGWWNLRGCGWVLTGPWLTYLVFPFSFHWRSCSHLVQQIANKLKWFFAIVFVGTRKKKCITWMVTCLSLHNMIYKWHRCYLSGWGLCTHHHPSLGNVALFSWRVVRTCHLAQCSFVSVHHTKI